MRGVLRHIAVAVVLLSATDIVDAQQEFEGWNLEPGIAQAHLVMVGRVTSISQVTVIEGAKTDVALREFRFQPVKVLKGIFQRDLLSMTGADLGLTGDAATSPSPLKEGEFRLLILAQSSGLNIYGCVSAAPGARTFGERVPLLSGADDPLVQVAETLIRVVDSRSRKERATLLIDRLLETRDLAAVPLLTSLATRADWAAADGRLFALVKLPVFALVEPRKEGDVVYTEVGKFLVSPHRPVRLAGTALLRDMLASGIIPTDRSQIAGIASVLRDVLKSDDNSTDLRLAALQALEHLLSHNLLALGVKLPWLQDVLTQQLTEAETYAERAAAAGALGIDSKAALLNQFAHLPLDELAAREVLYANAAWRVAPEETEKLLLDRLKRSIAAGQSLESEVKCLNEWNSKQGLPLLLNAAAQPEIGTPDRQQIATALGRIGGEQAVPVLIAWLRDGSQQWGSNALTALEQLDSDAAARELRPLLRTEPQLSVKLRIARLLARHGIADGYSMAIEHLADAGHTTEAALVLAALNDPRTVTDLSAILKARPDHRWHAAALTGLVAVGNEAARKELLQILQDDRNAGVAEAAEAVGLSADAELLPPLARLVQSRNPQIAMSSLIALRRFFSGFRTSSGVIDADLSRASASPPVAVPPQTHAALVQSVRPLVLDPYVEPQMRSEAFAVARLLGGDGYDEFLSQLADQAELEGSHLLTSVQAERKQKRILMERFLCWEERLLNGLFAAL